MRKFLLALALTLGLLATSADAQNIQRGGGGGSGTVGPGTTNTVPKFTGSTTVGNSGITDDGSTVSVPSLSVDFSSAAHTQPARKGTIAGKPGTCTQGEVYFATDATAGQNWFFCTSTNTWTQQLNSGGGGSPGGSSGNLQYNNAGALGGASGANWSATESAATFLRPQITVTAKGNTGSSPAPNMREGAWQTWTLNANATFTEPTNKQAGDRLVLDICQDGTGGRTVSFWSVTWMGGGSPSMPTTSTTGCLRLFLDYLGASWLGSWASSSEPLYPNAVVQGDVLYGSASNVVSVLSKDSNATRYLSNTGTSNNPAWAQVNLSNGVTGSLPVGNGGTGQSTTATLNRYLKGDGSNWATSSGAAAGAGTCSAGDAATALNSDAAPTCATFASAASTTTFTNKTLDAEGTGNTVTIPVKVWLPAAECQNTTATALWDLPTSNPAVAGCVTGSNTQKGVLDFADGANSLSAQMTLLLPSDWTGAVDAKFKWFSSTTSGNVTWQIATICVADGETDDPSFNSASAVVDATKGTANQTNDATITGITTTGCAAGELMHVKVFRDPTDGGDNLAGTARLIGVELTLRRAM